MRRSTHEEVEIKLPFDSAAAARSHLEQLGATPVRGRSLEENLVFDRRDDPLAPAGKLLRLRRTGGEAWLTLKAPAAGPSRHKVRAEHETALDDPAATERILAGLGFTPAWRYEKYRTVFELDGLTACLDETPLGCFVELEGDAEAIDRVAARLGFTPERYVLGSYRELQIEATRLRSGDEAPGDLLFGSGPSVPRP